MSKQTRKESNKVVSLIKANNAEFYISTVDLKDNSDDVLTAVEVINRIIKDQSKYKLKPAYMIISAGKKLITVVAYVPSELSERLSHDEWIRQSVIGLSKGTFDSGYGYTRVIIEDDTPYKSKDMISGNGFAYLTKKGCISDDESSEDDFIGFEDLDNF